MNNVVLPIGFKGKINTSDKFEGYGVKKGTKFKIVEPWSSIRVAREYVVKFYPLKKFKHLNEQGPILQIEHIENTEAMKILYGRKD